MLDTAKGQTLHGCYPHGANRTLNDVGQVDFETRVGPVFRRMANRPLREVVLPSVTPCNSAFGLRALGIGLLDRSTSDAAHCVLGSNSVSF